MLSQLLRDGTGPSPTRVAIRSRISIALVVHSFDLLQETRNELRYYKPNWVNPIYVILNCNDYYVFCFVLVGFLSRGIGYRVRYSVGDNTVQLFRRDNHAFATIKGRHRGRPLQGSRFGDRSYRRRAMNCSDYDIVLKAGVQRISIAGFIIVLVIQSVNHALQLRSEKWKLNRWVSRCSTQPTGWLFLGGEASNCRLENASCGDDRVGIIAEREGIA